VPTSLGWELSESGGTRAGCGAGSRSALEMPGNLPVTATSAMSAIKHRRPPNL